MKKNTFNKGDIVYCKAFVWTEYEQDLFVPGFDNDLEVLHIPAMSMGNTRKLLVRQEICKGAQKHIFMVIGIKQIQTGYYYKSISPSSNWTGYDEGEPASFEPDYYHNVYVLETMQTQRWQKVDFALETDLTLYQNSYSVQ